MNLVAMEMPEQGSSSPASRPDPQSTAPSFEKENEENRSPPRCCSVRRWVLSRPSRSTSSVTVIIAKHWPLKRAELQQMIHAAEPSISP